MAQITKPMEGQNDGQETATAHDRPAASDQCRQQLSGCTSLFPSRGPKIGAQLRLLQRVSGRFFCLGCFRSVLHVPLQALLK